MFLKQLATVAHVLQTTHAEFGHLTLLFCRERQRNVQRFMMHVHGYRYPH